MKKYVYFIIQFIVLSDLLETYNIHKIAEFSRWYSKSIAYNAAGRFFLARKSDGKGFQFSDYVCRYTYLKYDNKTIAHRTMGFFSRKVLSPPLSVDGIKILWDRSFRTSI